MQVSKRRVSRKVEKKVYSRLYQTIADIKNPQEAESFLKDLFSKTELSVMVKRLAVAYLLKNGKNYREIKERLKVSSATISSVAEQIEKGEGFKIALKKIEADEWAERWAEKIKNLMGMS